MEVTQGQREKKDEAATTCRYLVHVGQLGYAQEMTDDGRRVRLLKRYALGGENLRYTKGGVLTPCALGIESR